jgi:hypothetical protein
VTGFPGINFMHKGLGVGAEEINKFLKVNAAINFCYTSVALFNINIYIKK